MYLYVSTYDLCMYVCMCFAIGVRVWFCMLSFCLRRSRACCMKSYFRTRQDVDRAIWSEASGKKTALDNGKIKTRTLIDNPLGAVQRIRPHAWIWLSEGQLVYGVAAVESRSLIHAVLVDMSTVTHDALPRRYMKIPRHLRTVSWVDRPDSWIIEFHRLVSFSFIIFDPQDTRAKPFLVCMLGM